MGSNYFIPTEHGISILDGQYEFIVRIYPPALNPHMSKSSVIWGYPVHITVTDTQTGRMSEITLIDQGMVMFTEQARLFAYRKYRDINLAKGILLRVLQGAYKLESRSIYSLIVNMHIRYNKGLNSLIDLLSEYCEYYRYHRFLSNVSLIGNTLKQAVKCVHDMIPPERR